MRRTTTTIAAAALALALTSPVATARGQRPSVHTAHLQGAQEVPGVETPAQGQIILKVAPDGSEVRYRLNVANIDDILMAHLHMAPAGENGPIVVWLYPDGPPPQLIEGRTNGTLAHGTITAGDLIGISMPQLVAALEQGTVYANVHTPDHPGGEIRGQVG